MNQECIIYMIYIFQLYSYAHLTENDTNKEAEDEQNTGNDPIQPSITECTAHKMKGRHKCMFGCLIDFASLGSSFSPSPSPSPIPTPSHTLPPLLLLRLLPRLPPLCLPPLRLPPPLPLLLLLSLRLHCSSPVYYQLLPMLTLYYTVCEPVKYQSTNGRIPYLVSGKMAVYHFWHGKIPSDNGFFLPTDAWYSDSGILPVLIW